MDNYGSIFYWVFQVGSRKKEGQSLNRGGIRKLRGSFMSSMIKSRLTSFVVGTFEFLSIYETIR